MGLQSMASNLPMRERLAQIRIRLEKIEKALNEALGDVDKEAPALEVEAPKNG